MTAFLLRRLTARLALDSLHQRRLTFAITRFNSNGRRRSRRLRPDSELLFFNRLQQFRFKTEMADVAAGIITPCLPFNSAARGGEGSLRIFRLATTGCARDQKTDRPSRYRNVLIHWHIGSALMSAHNSAIIERAYRHPLRCRTAQG